MKKNKVKQVATAPRAKVKSKLVEVPVKQEVAKPLTVVDVLQRPGHDVMVLGIGPTPVEQHPRYSELAAFSQNMATLCLSNLNLVGKLLGVNLELKIFIKMEDVPSGAVQNPNS